MRMAPGRGRGHFCWWPLIFKFFFNLCFIGSVGFDDHLTDKSLASILFASASFGGGGCSAGVYQQIVKNVQKNFMKNRLRRTKAFTRRKEARRRRRG